jgi:S1-C subfamily serine protease
VKAKAATGVLVAAVVVLTTAAPTIPSGFDYQPMPRAQVDRILTAATVKLVALGCDLSVRTGTAVAIGSGRLMTNKHVVDGSRQVDAIPDVGPYTPGVTSVSQGQVDLATVRTPGLNLEGIPLAPHDPSPGALVVFAGYPGQDSLTIATGKVVDYAKGATVGQAVPVMRLAAVARPGMSGGPVLDGRGHLAGLIFGSESPSGYVLALPASALRSLLDHAGSFVPGRC